MAQMGGREDDDEVALRSVLDGFHDDLINLLNPSEVIHKIDGLSESDISDIIYVTRNEGDKHGNKLFLEILNKSSSEAQILFIQYLLDSKTPIHDDLISNLLKFKGLCAKLTGIESPTVAGHVHVTPQLAQRGPAEAENQPYWKQGIENYRITEDSPLEDVPNVFLKKWATMLNANKNWECLSDVLYLSRKKVKSLEKSQDPALDILDIMCEEMACTVGELIHRIDSANLMNVLQEIKKCLNTQLYQSTDTTLTEAALGQQVTRNTGSDSYATENQNQNHQARTINETLPNHSAQMNSKQQVRFSATEQNSDSRNVPQARAVVKVPFGTFQNRSNQQPETLNLEQNSASGNIPTSLQRTLESQSNETTEVNNPEQTSVISSGPNACNEATSFNQLPRQVGTSLPVEHSEVTSYSQEQPLIIRPEISTGEGFLGHLNSFRDIQNSIPGTRPSGNERNGRRELERKKLPVQQNLNASLRHAEKNVEQEFLAFRMEWRIQVLHSENEDEEDTQPKGEID